METASTTSNISDYETPVDDSDDSDESTTELPPYKSSRRNISRESTPSSLTKSGRRSGRYSQDTTPSVSRCTTPTNRKSLPAAAALTALSRSATPTKLTRTMMKKAEGIGLDLSDELHMPTDFFRRNRKPSDTDISKRKEEEKQESEEIKDEPADHDMETDNANDRNSNSLESSKVNGESASPDAEEMSNLDNPFQSYTQTDQPVTLSQTESNVDTKETEDCDAENISKNISNEAKTNDVSYVAEIKTEPAEDENSKTETEKLTSMDKQEKVEEVASMEVKEEVENVTSMEVKEEVEATSMEDKEETKDSTGCDGQIKKEPNKENDPLEENKDAMGSSKEVLEEEIPHEILVGYYQVFVIWFFSNTS